MRKGNRGRGRLQNRVVTFRTRKSTFRTYRSRFAPFAAHNIHCGKYFPRLTHCFSVIFQRLIRHNHSTLPRLTMKTKECASCHRDLPRHHFRPNGKTEDDLAAWCHECIYKTPSWLDLPDTVGVDRDKWCSACERALPPEMFGRNKRNPGGLAAWCKPCRRSHNKRYRRRADTVQTNYERLLKREYGLTFEEYQALARAQGGVCAICALSPTGRSRGDRLCVDHDHESGVVRGLLCGRCNSALGHAEDSPDRLMAMATYLRKPRPV